MPTSKDQVTRAKPAPKTVGCEVNACILVSKRGTLKEVRATESNYCKACKTPPTYASAFKRQATWTINKYEAVIELWARANGRAGQENTYEFPPPADDVLFFGDCILVSQKYESGSCAPLTTASWKKMYAHLFGGFANLVKLADADENEIDELEHISDKKKTRDGYLKDGFIVDDGAAAAARINIKSELHKMKLVSKPREYADGMDPDSDSEYCDDTSDADDDDNENSPNAAAAVNSGTAIDDSDDDADDDSDDDADDASDDEVATIDNDDGDDDVDDVDDDHEYGRARKDRAENKHKTHITSSNSGLTSLSSQLHPHSSQEPVNNGNNKTNNNNSNNNTYNIITKIKIVRGKRATIVPSADETSASLDKVRSGTILKLKQNPLKLKRKQTTKVPVASASAAANPGTNTANANANANSASDASELSEEPYEY